MSKPTNTRNSLPLHEREMLVATLLVRGFFSLVAIGAGVIAHGMGAAAGGALIVVIVAEIIGFEIGSAILEDGARA